MNSIIYLNIQERSDYLDKAEVAYQLQVQAQDTAEKAIRQLEDFISEDAQLVRSINNSNNKQIKLIVIKIIDFFQDRENAENAIQILRERSRTLTSLSIAKLDDENGETKVGHLLLYQPINLNK